MPLLLSLMTPMVASTIAQDEPSSGTAPEDVWSDDYINDIISPVNPAPFIVCIEASDSIRNHQQTAERQANAPTLR